jgi:hypothetical protein
MGAAHAEEVVDTLDSDSEDERGVTTLRPKRRKNWDRWFFTL